jgi:hypothetical protein
MVLILGYEVLFGMATELLAFEFCVAIIVAMLAI